MEIYPILNKPGKGKYVFIFILNERAVILGATKLHFFYRLYFWNTVRRRVFG